MARACFPSVFQFPVSVFVLCLRYTVGNFNENPSMRALAKILRARASEHSSDHVYLRGRVEKTEPRSADYPLTPAPRTTLRTTPQTTLRTTPTDYPKKSTKFLLWSTKIQKAYLLFLHDHNCTKLKTAAISFSYISRPSLFHFAPFFTGRPPARTLFPQWTIGKRC